MHRRPVVRVKVSEEGQRCEATIEPCQRRFRKPVNLEPGFFEGTCKREVEALQPAACWRAALVLNGHSI